MIEPEVTAVQGRRYLALLIDSALVVAAGLGAAYWKSAALPIVGRDADTGEPLVDPDEFERFESLLDFQLFGQSEILGIPVVRAQEIGDSMRIFGEDSYVWGVTVAVLVAVAVFLLIPALVQRTPGMLPFGLEVVGVDGTRAGVSAHVVRSVVGVVDMIPGVIPGLVGVIAANTSLRHQRLGDRVAGTAVVNAKLAEFRSGGDRVPTIEFDPRDDTPSDEPSAPDASTRSDAPIDTTTAAATTTAAPPVDEVQPGPEPVPASEHDAPLPPPPVHRKASADVPRGDLDQPLVDAETDRLDAHSLASLLGSAHGTSESVDTFADDERGESVSEAWDAPRVEPAPVWQPTPFDPAPAETPDPDDSRSIDDVVLGEPSVGELISAGPVVDAVAEGASSSAQHGRRAADVDSTGAKTPVWSDKWQAWMYFDAGKKCWLRHDTDTNTWVAVD